MYDPIPTRSKPLWWEGLAGVGYALIAVSASILLYNFAQEDGSATWRWALLVGVVVAFLIGAVLFSTRDGQVGTAERYAADRGSRRHLHCLPERSSIGAVLDAG